MKKNQYDDYYQPDGHYGKIIGARTKADFIRHQQWYFSWLKHISSKVNLNPFQSKKIIDLGGGIGAFCAVLLRAGFANVTCSDVSAEGLRLAKKFNPKLKTICFNIEKWRVRAAFELIFALEVLEHLKHPAVGIKNIFQALCPGGLFIGTTPYPFPKAFADPTHQHVWLPKKWQRLFCAAGFKKVVTYPMSFLPLFYRLNRHLNLCLPCYIKSKYFVSTTLIIAYKDG